MSAATRAPAGIPTGGQFTATAHAEAGTSLDPGPETPNPTSDAFDRITKLYLRVSEAAHFTATRSLAEHFLAQHPDAAYLLLADVEEGGMSPVRLTDAQFVTVGPDVVDGDELIGHHTVDHIASWINPYHREMMTRPPRDVRAGQRDLLLDLKPAAAKPIPAAPSA